MTTTTIMMMIMMALLTQLRTEITTMIVVSGTMRIMETTMTITVMVTIPMM